MPRFTLDHEITIQRVNNDLVIGTILLPGLICNLVIDSPNHQEPFLKKLFWKSVGALEPGQTLKANTKDIYGLDESLHP